MYRNILLPRSLSETFIVDERDPVSPIWQFIMLLLFSWWPEKIKSINARWGVGGGGGAWVLLVVLPISIHEIRYFDTINHNFATFCFCKTYNTGFTCFRSLIERKSRYFMGTMNHFTFQINSLIISPCMSTFNIMGNCLK